MSDQNAKPVPPLRYRFSEATTMTQADDRKSIALPYSNEEDVREALENFRSYLKILQEWDNRERERQCTRSEDVG